MELIDRYLNEIGRRLPKAGRDDIRAELRSALDDALEGHGNGEPSEDEVVSALRQFGPPAAVAASYSGDRYLIGPHLYPQFITTLRIVVTVLAGLVTLGLAVSMLTSTSGLDVFAESIADLVIGLLDSVITSLGIVVLVFALLERLEVGAKIAEKEKPWDPRQLPAVRDADIVGRFDSIAGIVFPAVILILINQFQDRIGIVVKPGGELLLNEVFLENLPWLQASLLLPMALNAWLFWSGRWHLSTRLLRIAIDVFGLYVVYRICQGAIAARPELLEAGIPERLVQVFIRIAGIAPMVVAVMVMIGAGTHLYKAFKGSARPDSNSDQPPPSVTRTDR